MKWAAPAINPNLISRLNHCSDYAPAGNVWFLHLCYPLHSTSTASHGSTDWGESVAGLLQDWGESVAEFVISYSFSCVSNVNTFCYKSDWRKFKRANKISIIREAACKPHISLNLFPFFFFCMAEDDNCQVLLSSVQAILREENWFHYFTILLLQPCAVPEGLQS